MLDLLRRDPVTGSYALKFGAIIALNAGVMAGLAITLPAASSSFKLGRLGSLAFLAIFTWACLSIFLTFGKAWERCRPFDMALPISGRKLWLSHILALVLSGLTFLALAWGVLEALFRALGKTPLNPAQLRQALADLVIPVSVTLILVVVLLQSIRPSLYRVRLGHYYLICWIGIASAGLGLILALAVLPPLAALAPLVIAVWLGYRTYRSVPAAFTLIPLEAYGGEAAASSVQVGAVSSQIRARAWDQAGPGATRGAGFGWFLFRLLYLKPALNTFAALFLFPIIILWGFFLSGFLSAWRDIELPQFSNVILSGYLLLSFLPTQTKRLPLIDALPVSRRLLFAFLTFPSLLALSIGCGAGRIGAIVIEKSKLLVKYQESDSEYFPPYRTKSPMIRIPGQYCEIAWDGQPPEIRSPWGESHPVYQLPLYRGSRITVYSPFSTPEGSSPQFVALQISRAIRTIYGETVPYQEILNRYLEVSDNQGVRLKQGQLSLLANYPGLKPQGEIALFPALMLMIGVTWLFMTTVYLRACRASVTDAGRVVIFSILVAVAIGSSVGQAAAMVAGVVRPDVGAAFLRILMRNMADATPGGNLAVWIVCTLVLLGAYWIAQSQFQKIEVLPGRPTR
jgi:hypothetical protein